MMTKLEQAARQALEALEYRAVPAIESSVQEYLDTITALREALDHSGEANDMVQEPVAEQTDKPYSVFDHLGYCPECGAENPPEKSDHEFKNFHRLLCERFDYGHDEKDWKRDQLSLIEWIANAAPVRTKDHCNPLQDLTDDEIAVIPNFDGFPLGKQKRIDFARAVIQEFRRKNGIV